MQTNIRLQAVGLTTNTYHADDDHTTDDHVTDDHGTDDHATDDYAHRWLASATGVSVGSDGEMFFTVAGWALLGVAAVHYFVSRWSELKLLRKAGCISTHDYHTRLCVIEKEVMEAKVCSQVTTPILL